MDDRDSPAVPASIDGSRVFVAVADDDIRDTLTEWLADRLDIVVDPGEGSDIDVCIVDRDGLDAASDTIEAARAEADPAAVPVLLVTPPPDGGNAVPDSPPTISVNGGTTGDSTDIEGAPAELIDETITRPIRFPVLLRRLRSLLRVRTLSASLCEREREYRNLLDLLAEGICLVEDGRIVDANDACCQLLAVDGDASVVGRRLTAFVADGDEDAVESLLATIADGEPATLACSLVTTTGDHIPVELAGAVEHEGTPPRIQLVIRDQRAQTHHQERIELFQKALDSAQHGITVADVTREDNPLIYANQTFTEVTGYATQEILGRNCRFLQGEETRPEPVARMRDAIDAREPTTVRLRNYRKDGTMFWNRVHLLPVQDGDGTVTHYLGFQQDVTEQVRHEQELERYRALVQAADDPIYTLDADGRFTHVNDALLSFTGYDRVDLVGEHASKVVDERDVEDIEELIRERLDDIDGTDESDVTTSGETTEIVVETADGDRRLCEVSIGFLPFEERFRGTVGILRDVTEPRGREQRLAVLERVLRHNLRNKTNVVLSRVEHIKSDEALPDHLADELDSIAAAATDIIDLSEQARQFRDVLALQRRELDTQDVVPVVADAVEETRTAHPDATIETTLPSSAAVRVRGRLRFAIEELLDNAIEHNDESDPEVTVTVTTDTDTVEIRIADNGPGLPEPEQKVATRERERPLEHGSGLGLWLVRWTVEQSGGEISLDDDDGTVVRLELVRATGDGD